jgi:hypothetical protein
MATLDELSDRAKGSAFFVPGNDIDAARKFYQRRGLISPDDLRTILRKYSDPRKLMAVVRKERWVIAVSSARKRASMPMLQVETRGGARLATFGLAGSRVIAVWHDEDYQSEVERNGIRGEYGMVRHVDGELFYDALMVAYPGTGPLRVVEVGGVSRT